VAASLSAYEYHAPAQTLPEGAEFLGLMVVLRHFVEAQRAGCNVDPATVRLQEPYLKSASITAYFDDLQRADLIQRGEAGGWLLSRSLDSTDLLRVYRHTGYRLPLQPRQEAQALGIDLPPALLDLLAEVAQMLDRTLGTRLDRAFPPLPPPEPETASA
jgi:membrane protein